MNPLDDLNPYDATSRTLLMKYVEHEDVTWTLMNEAHKRQQESPWQMIDLYCARRYRIGPRALQEQWDSAVSEQYEISPKTLANWRTLYAAFPPVRRRQSLSPAHHSAVLSLPVVDQELLLDLAESQRWRVQKLEDAVAQAKNPPTIEQVDTNTFVTDLFLSSGMRIDMTSKRATFQVNGCRVVVHSKSELEWSVE